MKSLTPIQDEMKRDIKLIRNRFPATGIVDWLVTPGRLYIEVTNSRPSYTIIMAKPDHIINDQPLPVASEPTQPDSQQVAEAWIRLYKRFNYEDQATLLEIDNPHHVSPLQVEAMLAAAQSAASGYAPKTRLSTPDEQGVQTGGTANKKAVRWMGHSGFSLARWMGQQGWTPKMATDVFGYIGIPMGPTAIYSGVYAGRRGLRGDPAPVSTEQARILYDALRTVTSAAGTATNTTNTTNTGIDEGIDEGPDVEEPPPTESVIQSPPQHPRKSKVQKRNERLDRAMKQRRKDKGK